MTHPEQRAQKPPLLTGFCVALRAILAGQGRSAPAHNSVASPTSAPADSRGSRTRLSPRRPLAFLLPIALLLALGASPAAASQPHAFAAAFGSPGAAAGQFELAAESGLAVDQSTGNVYVADTGNHRVDEFTASGAFIHAFGWGVATGAAAPQTCTTPCQAGLPGPEPGQFEEPTFIAVDNTPGGSSDVYVADLGAVANERQTVTVSATAGTYTLRFTSTVRGTTTNGSKLVTGVRDTFDIGDAISGPGIPPGTTIVGRPANETLELSASATASGTAALGATATTAPIAYNATHEQLQTALEHLRSLEGHVSVSGSAGGPYTVEFVGILEGTNVPQMGADSSGLSGAGATATVATAADGFNTARVQKFDSSGNLIAGWGGTPAPGQLDGTTCTTCPSNPHFAHPQGVLVKPEGNLLVFTMNSNDATRFTEWTQSSGEFIRQLGAGSAAGPIGIVVDSAGHVYAAEGTVPPFRVIQTSLCNAEDPSSPCSGEGGGEDPFLYRKNFTVDPGPATGVAVDPSTEAVYVARYNPTFHHSDVAGYDHEGNPLESFGGNPGEITESAGIAVYGANSDVYVADHGANRIEIFAPGGPRDTLTVTLTGTGLGSVASNPAGIACPSLCSTSFPANSEVTLTATAPEHATFLGFSGGGCSGAGPCTLTLAAATSVTAAFTQDPPALTTATASAITRHTATLTGTVDPEGDASSCRFEYGPTNAYGAEAPCASHPGSGAGPVAVSTQLWKLAAATTYHYRLVAANTGGATYGPDETFATLAEGCAANTALCLPLPTGPPLANVALVLPKQTTTTNKALTNAQKLAKALKACKKQKKKSARVSCEKQAKKRYAPAKKKVKKSTRSRKRG